MFQPLQCSNSCGGGLEGGQETELRNRGVGGGQRGTSFKVTPPPVSSFQLQHCVRVCVCVYVEGRGGVGGERERDADSKGAIGRLIQRNFG